MLHSTKKNPNEGKKKHPSVRSVGQEDSRLGASPQGTQRKQGQASAQTARRTADDRSQRGHRSPRGATAATSTTEKRKGDVGRSSDIFRAEDGDNCDTVEIAKTCLLSVCFPETQGRHLLHRPPQPAGYSDVSMMSMSIGNWRGLGTSKQLSTVIILRKL